MRNQTRILGVNIDKVTTGEVLATIENFISSKKPHQIVYVNADCLNKSFTDTFYKNIINNADLAYADGMAVVWASRFFGDPLPERVNAGDFLYELCELCIKNNYKIFFLGSEPGVAEKAVEHLKKHYPQLQIAGIQHGFFSDDEETEIISLIRKSGTQILLVGMGVPRQEKFIRRNLQKLRVPVAWGVGALFEYYSGAIERAPIWMRKAGLEWLFRLALEPARLWRRYLVGNFTFILRIGLLLISDAILATTSWISAYWIRWALNPLMNEPINPFDGYIIALPWIIMLWIISCTAFGLYHRSSSQIEEFGSILKAVFLNLLIAMATSFLFKEFDFGRAVVLTSGILNFLLLNISRIAARKLEDRIESRSYQSTRLLIVGTGRMAKSVMKKMQNHPKVGYEIVGFIDDDTKKKGQLVVGKLRCLGTTKELTEIIEREKINEIFIADPKMPHQQLLNLVVECEKTNTSVRAVSDKFSILSTKTNLEIIENMPVVDLGEKEVRVGYLFTKRFLDIILSTAGLAFTLPIWFIIAVAIKLDSEGRAIIRQQRVGWNGKTFFIYKFRSMYASQPTYELSPNRPDDSRITRFGKILRRTSLDELPQLINVLIGTMTLVGPRPEMPFIVAKYEDWQRKRIEVKPGITGLWQILGRKDLPLHENLEYDFYYIKNRSLILDITILLKTIPLVLFGKGAY